MRWITDPKGIADKVLRNEVTAVNDDHCINCGNAAIEHHEWPGLPAGVKFDPSDKELLEHLIAKNGGSASHPFISEFIPSLDNDMGICYVHPEELPGIRRDGTVTHYFCKVTNAYNFGNRKRRKIDNDENRGETRWHKTGKTRPVMDGEEIIGSKKIMVLYTNFGKHSKPVKTPWIMHQYHMGSKEDEKDGEYVVCKVFYQTQPRCSTEAGLGIMNSVTPPLQMGVSDQYTVDMGYATGVPKSMSLPICSQPPSERAAVEWKVDDRSFWATTKITDTNISSWACTDAKFPLNSSYFDGSNDLHQSATSNSPAAHQDMNPAQQNTWNVPHPYQQHHQHATNNAQQNTEHILPYEQQQNTGNIPLYEQQQQHATNNAQQNTGQILPYEQQHATQQNTGNIPPYEQQQQATNNCFTVNQTAPDTIFGDYQLQARCSSSNEQDAENIPSSSQHTNYTGANWVNHMTEYFVSDFDWIQISDEHATGFYSGLADCTYGDGETGNATEAVTRAGAAGSAGADGAAGAVVGVRGSVVVCSVDDLRPVSDIFTDADIWTSAESLGAEGNSACEIVQDVSAVIASDDPDWGAPPPPPPPSNILLDPEAGG